MARPKKTTEAGAIMPTPPVTPKRKYVGDRQIDHDLFKLDVAQTRKNISFQPDKPLWEGVDHAHFYHNVNSDGKSQTFCVSTAGHFHKVTVSLNDEGEFVAECGPPMVKSKGKAVPYKNDKHIHEITYVRSEKIQVRQYSDEAMKMLNNLVAEPKMPQ